MEILIVEDDPTTSFLLQAICRRNGYIPDVVQSVTGAKERIELTEKPYDLILWDHNVKDGTTLKLLSDAHRLLPECLMVATSNCVQARKAQMLYGCTKHLSSQNVLADLTAILKEAQAQAQARVGGMAKVMA